MPPLALFKNVALTDADTGGQTSSVGEPSIANNGRELFVSGNWYATKSIDAAGTWSLIDPFTLLPKAAGGFCCDQVTLYDPSRNLILWLLQYVRGQDGTNVLRLAIKQGGTLGDNTWYWWDFSPAKTNPAWAGEWFDFPDLELGDNFVYLTSNSFHGEQWRRSVVLRLPLDTLKERGAGLNYKYWSTTQNFALRCVRGAKSIMYFASHNSTTQLRVFAWPESANAPTAHDVNVSAWNAGPYVATGPDGTNWLARCDERITGAWLANGAIWLAWSANSRGTRPLPYVRVVEIDENTMQATADHDIWNRRYAYAYPNGAPNDRDQVGITVFRGGNAINPGHVVGIWNDQTHHWQLRATATGTNGPADNKWGDYLTCRRHVPDGVTWVATGYTLQGGGTRNDIEPRLVLFGHQGDQPVET